MARSPENRRVIFYFFNKCPATSKVYEADIIDAHIALQLRIMAVVDVARHSSPEKKPVILASALDQKLRQTDINFIH